MFGGNADFVTICCKSLSIVCFPHPNNNINISPLVYLTKVFILCFLVLTKSRRSITILLGHHVMAVDFIWSLFSIVQFTSYLIELPFFFYKKQKLFNLTFKLFKYFIILNTVCPKILITREETKYLKILYKEKTEIH